MEVNEIKKVPGFTAKALLESYVAFTSSLQDNSNVIPALIVEDDDSLYYKKKGRTRMQTHWGCRYYACGSSYEGGTIWCRTSDSDPSCPENVTNNE